MNTEKFDRAEAIRVLRKMQELCDVQKDCKRCPIEDICDKISPGDPLVWNLDGLEAVDNG